MSTLASAALSSDDEDDQDFQLPAPKQKGKTKKRRRTDSASCSSSSGSDDEVDPIDTAESQALKAEQEAAEAEERKERAEAAFEAMKNPSSSAVAEAPTEKATPKLVEVKRARQFAGETISETVMLPADHPDAIAYLKRESEANSAGTIVSEVPDQTATGATSLATPINAGPSKPKSKPPPRRKPRQSLEAMSAALDKGKKMTTLEKSQMDWKNHTAGDKSINDELEANRKAGGYLQKKDFLERVGERRMDTFESRQRQR